MTAWMVGIDTGGTFTDLIAFEVESRELRVAKVSSVPDDPASAVMNALDELFSTGVTADRVTFLAHGTTVATNVVLEGKGARTGLLITRGFRAVYEARGWSQPDAEDLLDPFYSKPPLLAPQSLTEEISERLDFVGEVRLALDRNEVRDAVRRLRAKGAETLAVCFLFSFLNAAHEEETAQIIAEEAPDLRVSLSSRVLPTIREYPRLSTTVIDAYVGPKIATYLSRLADRLTAAGVTTPQVFLMQSNGGLMRINIGARLPNQTLLSGLAAGVVSGAELARLTGRANVVTLDMGGTSTDISVISNGRTEAATEGRIAGQDIGTPMLSVTTLGAGGGTIAWIGKDGLLKVGPQSAGADPGPACYGLGSDLPTVTDANLLLGALGSENVLGGRMRIMPELAREAIATHIARPLGIDVIEAAAGIIRIVNTNMAIGLRLAFQRRGEDARKFALAACGGAGPLHAAMLARDLHIPTVLVPRHPGLSSAMGLLQTLVKHVYVQSSLGLLGSYAVERMNQLFEELHARAMDDIREEGLDEESARITRQIDMRYLHQGYQLSVDCPPGPLSEDDKLGLKRGFDDVHRRVYGVNAVDEDAEIVTFRVIVEISVPRLELPGIEEGDGDVTRAQKGERPLYQLYEAGFVPAPVFDRDLLLAGDRLAGPAIVEQFDSTTIILSKQSADIDRYGNMIVATGAGS